MLGDRGEEKTKNIVCNNQMEIGRSRAHNDPHWGRAQATSAHGKIGACALDKDPRDSGVNMAYISPSVISTHDVDNVRAPMRTPSPPASSLGPSHRLQCDKIDAIPPEARTPRKSPIATLLPRRVTSVELETLPRFMDTPNAEWPTLFSSKIIQCERFFDFTLPLCELRSKELKTAALNDLLWLIVDRPSFMGEQQYLELFQMVAKNIFRSLPPQSNPVGDAYDPEDDEPLYDPTWPHLHLVYETFIRLIESPTFNANIARKHIDQTFVHKLLVLFDVEDPRERDMVKTAMHRIYGKFLHLRAFIRKAMRHIFYEFVYEGERHNIAEMLEILGSVVNGFAVPLREEHKMFLERTLIPLHKNRLLPVYYQQLSLCIVQFAEKDSSLIEKIMLGLLRIWPKINTTKEIMFLNELEEILDVTPVETFPRFMRPLFHQIARSIASPHFQVAERALHYWNNEYIVTMVAEHNEEILPIVLPSMLRYSQTHWNKYSTFTYSSSKYNTN